MSDPMETLRELKAWADGYLRSRTGIGAGIVREMWPNLPPSAAKELLRRTEGALSSTTIPVAREKLRKWERDLHEVGGCTIDAIADEIERLANGDDK